MPKGANERTHLLNDASLEVVNEGFPRQINEPPPSYQMVADHTSDLNPSVSVQTSHGNTHAAVTNQPPLTMYYGYPHAQPSPVQAPPPREVSALPSGQPVYLIPASALSINSSQPLNYGQYGSFQAESTNTQPKNMNLPNHPFIANQFVTSPSEPISTQFRNTRGSGYLSPAGSETSAQSVNINQHRHSQSLRGYPRDVRTSKGFQDPRMECWCSVILIIFTITILFLLIMAFYFLAESVNPKSKLIPKYYH